MKKEKKLMKFKKFTEKAAALSMATAMLASVCAPTYTAVLSPSSYLRPFFLFNTYNQQVIFLCC